MLPSRFPILLFASLICSAQPGPFAINVRVPVGDGPTSLAAADFNGDGKKDLAVANRFGKSISILLGDGAGGFSNSPGSPLLMDPGLTEGPTAVAAGDFNGDGKADLAYVEARPFLVAAGATSVSTSPAILYSRLGVGDGTFLPASPAMGPVRAYARRLAVADMNGDGKLDVIMDPEISTASAGTGYQFLGDGTGRFSTAFLQGSTAIGDFNKDGRLDYIMVTSNGSSSVSGAGVFLADPVTGLYTQRFSLGPSQLSGLSPGTTTLPRVLVDDYDRDGALDVLFAVNQGSFGFTNGWRGDGAGGFVNDFVHNSNASGSALGGSADLALGDFDGDGTLDWAGAGPGNVVAVALLRLPTGVVSPEVLRPNSGISPSAVLAADFNGDGKADLAVANGATADVTILLTGPPSNLTAQNITFAAVSNRATNAPPFTPVVASSSGLPVTIASNTPTVCRTAGGTVTILAKGSCALTATQAGNGVTRPADPVSQRFDVFGMAQTIQGEPIIARRLGTDPFPVVATASSGLPVTALSGSSNTCSAEGLVVTLLQPGTCVLYLQQEGNERYTNTSSTLSFEVTVLPPVEQTIDFPVLADRPRATASLSVPVFASSGLFVQISEDTPEVCRVFQTSFGSPFSRSTANVTMLKTGTCSITVSQAGNSNYKPVSLTRTFQVQPVTPQPPNLRLFQSADASLASGGVFVTYSSLSTSPVVLTSNSPAICRGGERTITFVAGGVCSFTANQAANEFFLAATPVSGAVNIINGPVLPQTVTFPAIANYSFGVPTITLAASASSFLAVTFSSETPGICGVSGNIATLLGVGACTIKASQPGSQTYLPAAPISRTFSITPASSSQAQSLAFNAPVDTVLGAASITLTGSATSGLPVSFASNTTTVCAVSGNTLTLLAAGQCSITARQLGSAVFRAAPPVTSTFQVLAAQRRFQTVTFQPVTNHLLTDAPFLVSASASSGLPVTIATTGGACVVADGIVTLLYEGYCDLTANQAGDSVYAPAVGRQSLLITKPPFTGEAPNVESVLNAASYAYGTTLAPASYAAIFGGKFGSSPKVVLRDSAGIERSLTVVYAGDKQINVLIPASIPLGPATLLVTTDKGFGGAALNLTATAPGLFSARGDGQGNAAGQAIIVGADKSVTTISLGENAVPLRAGTEVYLVLYGTGIRGHGPSVSAKIGGQNAEVLYAGPQGTFPGLDQVNLRVPLTLVTPNYYEIALTVDGLTANTVSVSVFK